MLFVLSFVVFILSCAIIRVSLSVFVCSVHVSSYLVFSSSVVSSCRHNLLCFFRFVLFLYVFFCVFFFFVFICFLLFVSSFGSYRVFYVCYFSCLAFAPSSRVCLSPSRVSSSGLCSPSPSRVAFSSDSFLNAFSLWSPRVRTCTSRRLLVYVRALGLQFCSSSYKI